MTLRLDPDTLRCDALARPADPRALDVLRRARLTIDHDVRTWESSTGRVHGHRVHLGLDPASLALFACVPAVREALESVLAAAVSHTPDASLLDVVPHWRFSLPPVASAYRDVPAVEADRDDSELVARALAAFVSTAWGVELAAFSLRVAPDVVTVTVHDEVAWSREVREHVAVALDALLGDESRRHVRAVWRTR